MRLAAARGRQRGGGELFRERLRRAAFVRVLDQPPELTHAVGTNEALSTPARPDGREIQVMVAIDNLVKGAGGQAVQAMNLALGHRRDARASVGGGDLSVLTDGDDLVRTATRCSRSMRSCRCAGAGPWVLADRRATASEWLDAYGGHAVASTGHCHPHVVRAIAEQAAQLLFYSTAVPHPNREQLAGGSRRCARIRSPVVLLQLGRGGQRECPRTWRGSAPAAEHRVDDAAAGMAAPSATLAVTDGAKYEAGARRAGMPLSPKVAVRRRRGARARRRRHGRGGHRRAGAGNGRRARLLARVPPRPRAPSAPARRGAHLRRDPVRRRPLRRVHGRRVIWRHAGCADARQGTRVGTPDRRR